MAKPIVTTCGSGVSALVLTLALYRLGVRGTALYDGSWAEWGLPDGRRSRLGRPDRAISGAVSSCFFVMAGWIGRGANGWGSAAAEALVGARRARAAILRRWAARRACRRFWTALVSGFAPAALTEGCASMVTGGPVQCGRSSSGQGLSSSKVCVRRAGALVCPDAARAASFAGGAASRLPRSWSRRPGQAHPARADAASGFCRTFRDRDFGLAGSGGDESSGFSAAISFRFSRCREGRACSASAKGAAAGGTSGDFSPTGASTRQHRQDSSCSVRPCSFRSCSVSVFQPSGLGASRLGASVLLRKYRSGVACHDGLLANSSCAARSRALRPKPEDQNRQ